MPREYVPVLPDSKLSDFWIGYLRSTEKNSHNRYYVKCKYCSLEDLEGRKDLLLKHKAECPQRTQWPQDERVIKRPAAQANQPQITKFARKDSPLNQSVIAEKLLKAVVSTSVPFTFVNDVYVRELFDYVGVKIPNRDTLRCEIMPKVLEEVQSEQKEKIAQAEYVNVVIDGWTDSSHIYYVAVLLVFNNSCQYIGNLNFGKVRHTADIIAKELIKMIKEYVPELYRVVSIVTDSASVMKATKVNIVKEIGSMCALPCVLHILNLISKDVINHDSMQDLRKGATTVSTYFRKSHYWADKLKEWGEQNKVSGIIKSYCETRWFSFFEMCESIADKEDWFKSEFGLTAQGLKNRKDVSKEVNKFIIDSAFFSNMKDMAKYFGQIVKMSKSLEGNNASVVDVWPLMIDLLKYYEGLKSQVSPPFENIIQLLINAINKRSKPFHDDIFVIAFFCHRLTETLALARNIISRNFAVF